MENSTSLLISVDEIADTEPILLNMKYINGFSLYTLLKQREKITYLGKIIVHSEENLKAEWQNLSEDEQIGYIERAKRLRSRDTCFNMHQLLYPGEIYSEVDPPDEVVFFSQSMLMRDVSSFI